MRKLIFMVVMVVMVASFSYAGDDDKKSGHRFYFPEPQKEKTLEEKVRDLEKKVELLEKLILILQNNNGNTNENTVKYVVTLYDDSTFQIVKWNRKSKTQINSSGKKETYCYYEMVDIDGDVRTWSVDKVKSIEKE